MIYRYIKIIFISTILFVLFHFESQNIGPIKISILWKMPILIYLFLFFIQGIKENNKVELFLVFALILSFKFFISLSSFNYFMTSLTNFSQFSIFLFMYYYFSRKINVSSLEFYGNYISIFIILSFLPYQIGLIKSLGKTIDISKYGDISGFSLVGFHQNPHAAGIILSFSLTIILYNLLIQNQMKMKIIYSLILFIGIVELILTLVRTSYVMFLISSFILIYKKFKLKHYIFVILFTSIIGIFYFNSFINTNFGQSLMTRIVGDTKYKSAEDAGSGRAMFARFAYENWKNEGFVSICIGLGTELGKDKMAEKIGARLFAHNGFVQMLQSEGLVGFTLFCIFLLLLLKVILINKNNKYFDLLIALYISYVINIYFQGSDYFLLYLLFSIYLALLIKSSDYKLTKRI